MSLFPFLPSRNIPRSKRRFPHGATNAEVHKHKTFDTGYLALLRRVTVSISGTMCGESVATTYFCLRVRTYIVAHWATPSWWAIAISISRIPSSKSWYTTSCPAITRHLGRRPGTKYNVCSEPDMSFRGLKSGQGGRTYNRRTRSFRLMNIVVGYLSGASTEPPRRAAAISNRLRQFEGKG